MDNNTITFRILSYREVQDEQRARRARLEAEHGPFYEESLSMSHPDDGVNQLKATLLMMDALRDMGYNVVVQGPGDSEGKWAEDHGGPGYWPVDHPEVDPRFQSDAPQPPTLEQLLASLRERKAT